MVLYFHVDRLLGRERQADRVRENAGRAGHSQTGNVPNWDAVGLLHRDGTREWLLIEAKAHRHEIRSSRMAKPKGGLEDIKSALEVVKQALAVTSACDWLNGYYQFCNRVALLQFLRELPGSVAHCTVSRTSCAVKS